MKSVISLFALLLSASLITFGQTHSPYLSPADPAGSGQSTQISGCLQGSTNAYRLVTNSGNAHLLMGDQSALNAHVGDRVTLEGYRDNNRDASASSDEGTYRGLRYFRVDSVKADTGKCNVR